MTTNGVSSDGSWALQSIRVVEGPDVGSNSDSQIEKLAAFDFIVGYFDVGVATLVLAVHHVDGAKSEVFI